MMQFSHRLTFLLVLFFAGAVTALKQYQKILDYQPQNITQVREYRKFLKAKAKWESAAISNYKIEAKYSAFHCEYELVFFNKQTIHISNKAKQGEICENFQPHNMLNVDEIFHEIETYFVEEKCGPNGCSCDGRIHVHVNYDQLYNYPKLYKTTITPPSKTLRSHALNTINNLWSQIDYYLPRSFRSAIVGSTSHGRTGCTLLGSVPHTAEIISFKILD